MSRKEMDPTRLRELRLYSFFLFTLWPFVIVFSLFYFLYGVLIIKPSKALKSFYFILLPYHLINIAHKEKKPKMILAILLLFPFVIATLLSPIFILLPEHPMDAHVFYKLNKQSLEKMKKGGVPEELIPALNRLKNREFKIEDVFVNSLKRTIGEEQTLKYGSLILSFAEDQTKLQPPYFYRLFNSSGAGMLGTNSEGIKIERLIFSGAGQVYFTSLAAVIFSVIIGTWLGKLTYSEKIETLIMGVVEVLEAIPIIFIILIIMAKFGWWENTLSGLGIFVQLLWMCILPLTVGIGLGLGFLPRVVRLIRERIKTFVLENFVDGAKAHGIKQNRILWFHIIRKNCIGDIIIVGTQIWAAVILLLINLAYLISIFPSIGAKKIGGWAKMLMASETRKQILLNDWLNLNEWWLYVFPIAFITITITGFYLFGDNLQGIYYERKTPPRKNQAPTNFDKVVRDIAERVGM